MPKATATIPVVLERDISLPLIRSFMAKVATAPNGCWLWTASKYPTNGYGYFRNRKAHRVAYELFVGPIGDGMTIDHACHSLDLDCPGGHCSHLARDDSRGQLPRRSSRLGDAQGRTGQDGSSAI